LHALSSERARNARAEQALNEEIAVQSRRLAASDELFRLLVANIRDYAIFMLDPDGNVATWNAGACGIKGYAAEDIIGRHFSTFYPAEDVQRGKCEMELEVAAREGRFEDEGWRVRKDGSQFWANVVITAIQDAGGVLVGFAKITRDLTERKRSEDDRAARLAAEEANRVKDEFLAILGHELRNPLAPIVTALQLAKLHGDTISTRELQIIERQVHLMAHLVDDLLDVARVTRGKLALSRQIIDLRDAISRAVEIASPLIEEKSQHFEVEVPPHALLVDGDALRLTQVFANLLTNAAKYTDPRGSIALVVREIGAQVVVDVRDDGTGITAELLPRMFDPFVQGPRANERAGGGLGLGLGLVRSLIELHGGEVNATSAGHGQGSTFTVRIPMATRDATVATARPLAAATGRAPGHHRLLVVDDNEDARMLLADVLVELGHDVKSAGDGEDALRVAAAFSPEIAILDIGLPGMDGYELAAQLRQLLPASGMRMIALTGYGQPTDQARSEATGFDRHLVKPVELRRLLDAIAELSLPPPAELSPRS
jgi:PAS domain S-box-containing protein